MSPVILLIEAPSPERAHLAGALAQVLQPLAGKIHVEPDLVAAQSWFTGAAPPDLVILDPAQQDAQSEALLRWLRSSLLSTTIVLLSAKEAQAALKEWLASGKLAVQGSADLRSLCSQMLQAQAPLAMTRTALDPRALGLTARQIDVLERILRGLPNKLICRELELAEGTVKVHVSAVLRALGASNRTQAVIAATRLGLTLAPRHRHPQTH